MYMWVDVISEMKSEVIISQRHLLIRRGCSNINILELLHKSLLIQSH